MSVTPLSGWVSVFRDDDGGFFTRSCAALLFQESSAVVSVWAAPDGSGATWIKCVEPHRRVERVVFAIHSYGRLEPAVEAHEDGRYLGQHDRAGVPGLVPRPHYRGAAITTTDDDPDPIDRSRGIDLASAGLAGYCATILITGAGEEILLLAAYSQGVADYVTDWNLLAPHEIPGLPIYLKD